MNHHNHSNTYALRLRTGLQNSLLSPLLVQLYARMDQLPDARIIAVIRYVDDGAHEWKVMLTLPGHSRQQACNFLVAWAETTIDELNHAYPYSVPSLLNQGARKEDIRHEILVKCTPVVAEQWLHAHSVPQTAPALMVLSGHLRPLLSWDSAQLKTTLPVAINAAWSSECPRQSSALFAAVFAQTVQRNQAMAMLRNWQRLENAGRVIRIHTLPVAAATLFTLLLTALQHGMAHSGVPGTRLGIIRLLLNQLGFVDAESDYIILLSLPQDSVRLLHQELGLQHEV